MILTGHEIEQCMADNKISISDFDIRNMGPNSYNLHLHNELMVYDPNVRVLAYTKGGQQVRALDMKHENDTIEIDIPEEGFLLNPGILYLGRTVEYTETHAPYVPMLEGRSSIARLGMSIHATAGFGDIGYKGYWTLEISVIEPLIIYPWVPVGQIFYLKSEGEVNKIYQGKYQNAKRTLASRLHVEQDQWTSYATPLNRPSGGDRNQE